MGNWSGMLFDLKIGAQSRVKTSVHAGVGAATRETIPTTIWMVQLR
ncbi:MAG: hypothetical protein HC892_13000 [Saprospiraceae bacterium]|nr:hypothetical protein [Saprospiraceae bacterium]